MHDYQPSPEIEERLQAISAAREPDPAFAGRLRMRLLARAAELSPQPKRFSLRLSRPAVSAALALGVIAALAVAFLAIGPERVATAMRQLFHYLPGFGLVEQTATIRVLAAPLSANRDGVTLTIESAVLGPDRTVIVYTVDGISREAFPTREDIADSAGLSKLRLPDGTLLGPSEGSSSGWGSGYQRCFGPGPDGHRVHGGRHFAGGFSHARRYCRLRRPVKTAPAGWHLARSFGRFEFWLGIGLSESRGLRACPGECERGPVLAAVPQRHAARQGP